MKKFLGISLLEQLLVLSIVGLIIILGVQRYRLYEEQEEVLRIKTDLGTIFSALDNYFHQQGCSTEGKFNGKLKPSLDQDLQIINLTSTKRYLKNYAVEIQRFGNQPQIAKPLYEFVIMANTTDKLLSPQLRLLANQTGSYSVDVEHHLIQWQSLPSNEYQQYNSQSVLSSRLARLRQQLSYNEASCAQ